MGCSVRSKFSPGRRRLVHALPALSKMAKEELIIDMGNRDQKMKLLAKIGALSGPWRIDLRPYKPSRSLKANAYLWVAVYPAFRQFMESNGQFFEPEEIHEYFLQKFASKPVIDPVTGEVMSVIGKRSSQTDTSEFSEYVSQCKNWMIDKFGIVVAEPELK